MHEQQRHLRASVLQPVSAGIRAGRNESIIAGGSLTTATLMNPTAAPTTSRALCFRRRPTVSRSCGHTVKQSSPYSNRIRPRDTTVALIMLEVFPANPAIIIPRKTSRPRVVLPCDISQKGSTLKMRDTEKEKSAEEKGCRRSYYQTGLIGSKAWAC